MSKSKRKLLISMLAMMFVLLSAVAIVAIAFALTQQNITTTLDITYHATRDVYATITGGVYSNNIKMQDINFTIDGETENGDLGLKDIDIDSSSSDKSVYIEFIITNNQPNDEDGEFYVNPAINTTTSENIKTTRYVMFEDEIEYEEFTESNIYVQQNQTIYIRLKFEVEEIKRNASLQGTLALNFYSVEEKPTTAHTSTIAGVGHYPQQYVGDSLNETLKSATLTETGKTYTTYIETTLTTLTEYEYNDIKIAKLTNSSLRQIDDNEYVFSTGDAVSSNEIYYFYVQPIRVSAVSSCNTNGVTKTIFITDKTIFSKSFDSSTTSWENSSLRSFLNGDFLTESGINATEISIENGTNSGSFEEQDNTNDTLWLPSKTEMETWYTTSKSRMRSVTDMALATFTHYYASFCGGLYWTRSSCSSTEVFISNSQGSIGGYKMSNSFGGVVFAFAM